MKSKITNGLKALLLGALLLGTLSLSAQLEDELGFMYVKAEYMIETDRYQEAAMTLSKIIKQDASFKDALVLRAECFYEIGENDKAIDDILNSFKLKGVDGHGIKVFAMANAALGNHEVAENSLDLSLLINYRDPQTHFAKAENYKSQEMFDEACEHWEIASNMGHEKSKLQARKYCGVVSNDNSNSKKRPKYGDPVSGTKLKLPNKTTRPPNQNDVDDDPVIMDEGVEFDDEVRVEQEVPMEEEIKIDDSVKEIDVDEELSLVVKNGIGSRKILQQPDILILSESSGDVAVDICINRRGKVESSEYNELESSLKTPSLISLAKRKSMEFWFEKSDEKEMCGTIIFKINNGG